MFQVSILITMLLLASEPQPGCGNQALVVDEKAEGIQYRGCWQVVYVVAEEYPAPRLVERVTGKLQKMGWEEIHYDPFGADATERKTHQWLVRQAKDEGNTRVDHWLGWFIRRQELVQVSLEYYGRPPESTSAWQVVVRVTFVPEDQWNSKPQ